MYISSSGSGGLCVRGILQSVVTNTNEEAIQSRLGAKGSPVRF